MVVLICCHRSLPLCIAGATTALLTRYCSLRGASSTDNQLGPDGRACNGALADIGTVVASCDLQQVGACGGFHPRPCQGPAWPRRSTLIGAMPHADVVSGALVWCSVRYSMQTTPLTTNVCNPHASVLPAISLSVPPSITAVRALYNIDASLATFLTQSGCSR